MRVFLGFLVAAIALAAAVWIHSGLKARSYAVDTGVTASGRYVGTEASQAASNGSAYAVEQTVVVTHHRRASWQDPVAVFLAVAGVGAGSAIVFSARGLM